jgi:hypothetical protein
MTEEKKVINLTGRLVTCVCESVYQDQTYGKGKRWANQKLGDKKKGDFVCTQCGRVHKCV